VEESVRSIGKMKESSKSYWSSRILTQLEYALQIDPEAAKEAVEELYSRFTQEGALTDVMAKEAEESIRSLSAAAKSFRIICASHAHIDMNWMWGFAETVAVTLGTFRTMLDMMEEYPKFTFSQSQASVYRIVEEYDPEMLEEIKKRVKEGRWEVTASTWVETDKNMPNGESLSRHILYTKKYLSELLELDPESLDIDFEPDTFGHSLNIPEILNKGGVKYYYHCRGYDGHNIYRWTAPSGSDVLVYKEPYWYNDKIFPEMVLQVPEFCREHGIDTMIKVYGVGDHGGGPTRRDIERIIDMGRWPVFPQIDFGTFSEFFETLGKRRNEFPEVDKELNFIFPGCYTTQTRIKMANRIGEAKLYEAEAFSSIASVYSSRRYDTEKFAGAWEKILFNHFHDILPGSGVIDTREYSMGEFQKILAEANTQTEKALESISANIDTSVFGNNEEDISGSISEGAGAGFGIKDFGIPVTERGKGVKRLFHFFNPSPYERNELAEIIVWDWPGDKNNIFVTDTSGKDISFQMLENESIQFFNRSYWGHEYMRLLVDISVPACGYSTCVIDEKRTGFSHPFTYNGPRVEKEEEMVLENDKIRVEFCKQTMWMRSMTDKTDGKELIDKDRPGGVFRLVEEDDARGMTAWIVGRYVNIFELGENVRIKGKHIDSRSLRQGIEYSIDFRGSKINVTVSLDQNSSFIDYKVECDWQEKAKKGQYVPQLNFHMPINQSCRGYKYDVPFGTVTREGMDMDVPANSFAAALPDAGSKGMMLMSDTKYGFRCLEDSMSLTLIRSSYDPDPYPDNGIHRFKITAGVIDCGDSNELIRKSFDYNHPVRYRPGRIHKGEMPGSFGFLKLDSENISISSIKMAENDKELMIIKLYETQGRSGTASLTFAGNVRKAFAVDLNERPVEGYSDIKVEENMVYMNTSPYSIQNIAVLCEC